MERRSTCIYTHTLHTHITHRALLAEERERLAALEGAWKGVLGGTHDAEIKCNTQKLSTGTMYVYVRMCMYACMHV